MSARKFLALALAACQSKQYEEAGVFLGQAAKEPDAAELAKELGADEEPIATPASISSEFGEGDDVEDVAPGEGEEVEAPEEEFDWGDEEESDDDESGTSTSSATRRRSVSRFRIGTIMAAAMSVSGDDSEEEASEDEEEDDSGGEVDPDFPGETLIPASFSSVKVKVNTDESDS